MLKTIPDKKEHDKKLCYKACELETKEEQLDTLQKLVKRLDGEKNLLVEYMENLKNDTL